MQLTTQQISTLKIGIQAIPNFNTLNEQQIADVLNVEASPEYWTWKTSLGRHDLTDNDDVDTDGTTPTAFVWGGATGGYINRSQGERDCWDQLFNTTGLCKPHLASVRTAFADIYSGAGAGAVANRKHCWARAQRKCTAGEKLFVVQTVGGPTQTGNRGTKTNPDTLGAEGEITVQNVIDALNS